MRGRPLQSGRTPAYRGGMQERFAGSAPAATMPSGQEQRNRRSTLAGNIEMRTIDHQLL